RVESTGGLAADPRRCGVVVIGDPGLAYVPGAAAGGRAVIAYIARRLAYAIPILLGVNVITFVLFFVVNSPEDMARLHLGTKHVTEEAIEKWKSERGYDKPLLWNAAAAGGEQLTDTIF